MIAPLAFPVKSVVTLSTGSLLIAQVAPLIAPTAAIDAAGRLTLDAALVFAVVSLWKALGQKDQRISEKDAQIVGMATKVTETMVLVMEAVKELRLTVGELKAVMLADDHRGGRVGR